MNFSVEKHVRDEPDEQVKREVIRALLNAVGAKPEFEVKDSPGRYFCGEVVSFTDGQAKYLGLIRDYKSAIHRRQVVDLRGRFHVYKVSVHVDIEDGKIGRHVVSMQVFNLKGELLKYYSQKLVLEGGRGRLSIRLALNDEIGPWRVEVKDVSSGVSAEANFVVK